MKEKPTLADISGILKKTVLIRVNGKAPVDTGWQKITYEQTQNDSYQRNLKNSVNVGVQLGVGSNNLCSIDCDTPSSLEWLLEHNPKLAGSFRVVGARGAQIYAYIEGERPTKVCALKVPEGHFLAIGARGKTVNGLIQIGEFRAEGGQSVLIGIHPISKCPYHWPVDNPPITIAFENIVWHPDIVLPWASQADDAKSHSTSFGGNGNGDHEADEEGNETLQEATRIVTIDFLWKYFEFPPRIDKYGKPLNPGPSPFRDDNNIEHHSFSISLDEKSGKQLFKDFNAAYEDHKGDSYKFFRLATEDTCEAFIPFMEIAESLKNGEDVPPYSKESPGSVLYLPASYSRTMEPGAPLIGEEAYIGFAGDFVKATEPQTECNRGNLLLQFLVVVGVLFGRYFYNYLGQNLFTNLFLVMLGPTGAARKGTALLAVKEFIALVAPEWRGARSGWKSGEALVHFARDATYKADGKGVKDEGVADKRILVEEPELIHLFKTSEQKGNTLTAKLREAWDSPAFLANTTRNTPEYATAPHIGKLGHITKEELLLIDPGLISNGLLNRMLFGDAFQARKIADPQPLEWPQSLVERFRDIYAYAYHPPSDVEVKDLGTPGAEVSKTKHIPLDANAKLLWEKVYLNSPVETGTLAAVLERFFPQVRKVANIYAICDKSPVITRPHLEAGFAIANHSKACAKIIFADFGPNKNANRILAALRRNPDGLSLTQISSHVFNRKTSSDDIHAALIVLNDNKLASRSITKAATKPNEIWRAI